MKEGDAVKKHHQKQVALKFELSVVFRIEHINIGQVYMTDVFLRAKNFRANHAITIQIVIVSLNADHTVNIQKIVVRINFEHTVTIQKIVIKVNFEHMLITLQKMADNKVIHIFTQNSDLPY